MIDRPALSDDQIPDARAILGLADAPIDYWDNILASRMQLLRGRGRSAMFFHCALILLAAAIMAGQVPLIGIAAWSLISVAATLYSGNRLAQLPLWDRRTLRAADFRAFDYHAAGLALLWTGALVLTGWFGALETVIAVWSVFLLLMIVGATMGIAVPSAVCALAILGSVASAGVFLVEGGYWTAVTSLAIGAMLSLTSIRGAGATVLQQLSESGLQEKSETVSLLLREFEDTGADWLWQTDTARQVVHVSPRFAYALGAEAREIEGEPLLKLMAGECWDSGRYPSALHDLAERLKRREAFSNLIVPVSLGGRLRWWELSASPRLGDDGSFLGFRGVGSDVTAQRESADKISHLARFDTLTGLPNRLQLTEALGKALANADRWNSRCAFMMIDLDRFKAVNDTLGHPVGDRLLARVSKRLQSIMTENELCGRLGGDEFAVVLKDAQDAGYIGNLAGRIISTLSSPYEVDQHTLYIGASVGSALGPRDGRSVETLMRSADLALYRSKDEGGGVHHAYQPQFHTDAEERRLMEIELRQALEKDELTIEYQPVVDATGQNIVTFEALLRWTNGRFGRVSPAKFVPLAEDARLIVPIGEWVLAKACREALNWPESVRVAVNVSADQLHSSSFLDSVVGALTQSGLPPWRLELEVTESVFMRDGSIAGQVLDRILGLGVQLSLDDFGTGYSSLGYLRKTRFNTIKIDRSFVQGAAKNVAESIAICRAVVAMADSLGMSTTAEGVESEEELAMVQRLGCKKVQGYYFGRPMPLAETAMLFAGARAAIG